MQRQWSICAFLSAVDVCSLGIVPKSLIYKLMTDEEKKNVKKYLDKKQPGGFSMWKSGEKYFSEYYIWWKSSQFSFLPFPFEIENIHRMLASSHFSHPLHIFALPLSLSLPSHYGHMTKRDHSGEKSSSHFRPCCNSCLMTLKIHINSSTSKQATEWFTC